MVNSPLICMPLHRIREALSFFTLCFHSPDPGRQYVQIQGKPHFRRVPCLQQSIHPAKFAIFISYMGENCMPKMTGKLTFSGVDEMDQSYMADPTTNTTSQRLHLSSHGLTQAVLGSTFHCVNHTTAPSPLTTVSSTTSSPFQPCN